MLKTTEAHVIECAEVDTSEHDEVVIGGSRVRVPKPVASDSGSVLMTDGSRLRRPTEAEERYDAGFKAGYEAAERRAREIVELALLHAEVNTILNDVPARRRRSRARRAT